GAEVVQGPRNEFLPGTGLPENEDSGIGGGDRLDLLQDPAEGGTLADDLPEVLVGADLRLQVDLLLGELVLERLDLLEDQGIFDCQGHLVSDELQKAQVRRIVGGGLLARESQRTQPPPGRGQRERATAPASSRP